MKWWILLLINVAVFFALSVLGDLWWLEKPYSQKLLFNWAVKAMLIGGIFTFLFRQRKTRSV